MKHTYVQTGFNQDVKFEKCQIVRVVSDGNFRDMKQYQVKLNNGQELTVPENIVFDHKPVKTVVSDCYGNFTRYV